MGTPHITSDGFMEFTDGPWFLPGFRLHRGDP
jgi:hypothetical protein